MTTIVLSFLRLGDFFQHVPLLRALTTSRPGSITVLGFTELKAAVDLFPEFQFHLIAREEMLEDMSRKDSPWYRAGWILEKYVRAIDHSADLLVNLSHTKFSARLMDCLKAAEKWGVQFENGRSAGWNPWLKAMNENWVENREPQLTYTDFLARAMGLTLTAPTAPNTEGGEIWLQPLTSDEKKNWSMGNWQYLAKQLSKSHPVKVICAPSEQKILSPWFAEVHAMTFAEIRAHKDNCRLFVSGDTSVIHFAALEMIPTLGIYLGSANPYKTAPRQIGAWIVTGNESCWPCAHRAPCSRASHLCGEAVRGKDILKMIEEIIEEKSLSSSSGSRVYETTVARAADLEVIEGGRNGSRHRGVSSGYTPEA